LTVNSYIGVDNAGDIFPKLNNGNDIYNNKLWMESIKELGAEFVVFHYRPEGNTAEQREFIKKMSEAFEENDLEYILNLETANWGRSIIDKDGWDWANHPDGLHYFNFKPEVLKETVKSPAFLGVMYDEPEHMQMHNNYIFVNGEKFNLPFFADTKGMSLTEAEDAVNKRAARVVNEYKTAGTLHIAAEHVFPVLFHNFASAGMTLSYKQMKENWNPVWAACAMGAALQYNAELWACIDLWGIGKYPGHSPDELKNNLIYAHWLGNDRIYVENLNYNGSLYSVITDDSGIQSIKLSEYGEIFRWFAKEYLPNNPRNYTFRDLRPDVAIIRFDDTDCGQGIQRDWDSPALKNQLYGNSLIKSNEITSNWIKIWHLISHGEILKESLSWNFGKKTVYSKIPHKSFAPVNNVVVFDEKVRKNNMKTLKLAFLTGITVSKATLEDLQELVKENGLIVVSTPELTPESIKKQYTEGTFIIDDGKKGGKWIVTDNVLDEKVREQVKPYLGNNDEMRYVFGENQVLFKLEDADTISVSINGENKFKNE